MRILINLISTLTILAGLAALVAVIGAFRVLDDDSAAWPLVTIVVQTSLVCIGGAAAALYAGRTRRVFPGDVDTPARLDLVRSIVAVGLIALPVAMILRLRSFASAGREVIERSSGSRMWEDASSNVGGLVMIPVAIVSAPPVLAVLTMAGFLLASAALLVWILRRRPALARWFVAWLAVLATLHFAAAQARRAAEHAAAVVGRALASSDRQEDELQQVASFVERYMTEVNTAGSVLTWTLVGYVILLSFVWFAEARRSRT